MEVEQKSNDISFKPTEQDTYTAVFMIILVVIFIAAIVIVSLRYTNILPNVVITGDQGPIGPQGPPGPPGQNLDSIQNYRDYNYVNLEKTQNVSVSNGKTNVVVDNFDDKSLNLNYLSGALGARTGIYTVDQSGDFDLTIFGDKVDGSYSKLPATNYKVNTFSLSDEDNKTINYTLLESQQRSV